MSIALLLASSSHLDAPSISSCRYLRFDGSASKSDTRDWYIYRLAACFCIAKQHAWLSYFVMTCCTSSCLLLTQIREDAFSTRLSQYFAPHARKLRYYLPLGRSKEHSSDRKVLPSPRLVFSNSLPDPETWLGKHPAWTSLWRSNWGLASPLLDLLAH
jgi:hypothetical protein